MTAIIVDDERLILQSVMRAVSASSDIREVYGFTTGEAALDYVRSKHVDVAFLDIHMRGISGLQLAEMIQQEQRNCKIIFCTDHEEHALEAFRLHVTGYLMKPVTEGDVQRELDHIQDRKTDAKLLTVVCFGEFEVYANGYPLVFHRKRAKEVFAYLIDRKGAGVTVSQICAALWEDALQDQSNKSYVRTLLVELQRALRTVGAESVLVKHGIEYSVDLRKIDCDYIRYSDGAPVAFLGEYMRQYSWAEGTCALLRLGKQ